MYSLSIIYICLLQYALISLLMSFIDEGYMAMFLFVYSPASNKRGVLMLECVTFLCNYQSLWIGFNAIVIPCVLCLMPLHNQQISENDTYDDEDQEEDPIDAWCDHDLDYEDCYDAA